MEESFQHSRQNCLYHPSNPNGLSVGIFAKKIFPYAIWKQRQVSVAPHLRESLSVLSSKYFAASLHSASVSISSPIAQDDFFPPALNFLVQVAPGCSSSLLLLQKVLPLDPGPVPGGHAGVQGETARQKMRRTNPALIMAAVGMITQ